MAKKEITISVIGAGACGIILLNQLVEKFAKVSGYEILIRIVEKSGQFGPGIAYSTPIDSHILNMRANTMGAKLAEEGHFSKWITRKEESLKKELSENFSATNEYPPRKIFGRYLKALFEETLKKAGHSSIEIQPIKGEVIDLIKNKSSLDLVLKDGSILNSDNIILSLGNFPPTNFLELKGIDDYIPYPWPVTRILEKINPDKPVCILGSGLSAIDTLFTLLENGHNEKIYFVSRRGLLPKVQGAPFSHVLKFIGFDKVKELIKENGRSSVPFEQIGKLFIKEVEAVEESPINWLYILNPTGTPEEILEKDIEKAKNGVIPYQAALIATAPIVGYIWNILSIEDKCAFDKGFKSVWTVYRHPMPLCNAKKILEILKSGQLEILFGCRCVRSCGSDKGFEIDIQTRFGILHSLKTRYLINATGQGLDVSKFGDPFLNNLLAKGFIECHPNGGIWVDFHTGQVISKEGIRFRGLFALGEITRGVHFFTNGITPNVLYADQITNCLIQNHTEQIWGE